MKERRALIVSGAAGVALAALVYFLTTRVSPFLRGWVLLREAEIIAFVILLVFTLLEIPVMVFGLRTLYREKVNRTFFYAVNGFYVAFASFYAAVLVLLFGESGFSALLVSLSLARWASDWWIR